MSPFVQRAMSHSLPVTDLTDYTTRTECSRIGCYREANSTTLAGATRVPTCLFHEREYVERYPDSADTVWPLSLSF